ncbi:ARM repeat superfamily protein isoform 2 [Hibiscus syriacus]|uniref:RING-type E3 ubiquitin transferase n=1 Tax=Hibiscus syriacus TaxID=106335 RepID=A0A6A2Z2Z7_HIBSY|nr:ARM repeat superfamily protein isoform 2 [Hibiscus syriacus]
MDTTLVKCLINSIARFIHLVSCMEIKVTIEKEYRNMVMVSKHLKPLLDDAVDCEIPSDEDLCKECEELDRLVNEAREFMENWSPKMSKIQMSPPSTSSITSVEHCIREIKCLKQERQSEYIGEALSSLKEGAVPCTDHLVKVIKSLNLASNHELTSIQKWLDSGLSICPMTRQTLEHTNLIPNHTVKAMVANWSEKHLQLSNNTAKLVSISSPSNHIPSQDLTHTDSFHCLANSSCSTSRSSLEVGNGLEKLKIEISSRLSGEWNRCQSREIDKYDQSSNHSYIHSRTESAVSEVSSIDYAPPATIDLSRRLKKHEMPEVAEISSECLGTFPSEKKSGISSWPTGKQLQVSGTKEEEAVNGNCDYNSAYSIKFSVSRCDDLTTSSHVMELVDNLKSPSNEVQTIAAAELRFLARKNMDNRSQRGKENAASVLVQLCLNSPKFCTLVLQEGAVPPLVALSQSGTPRAKEKVCILVFPLVCHGDAVLAFSAPVSALNKQIVIIFLLLSSPCTTASQSFSEAERRWCHWEGQEMKTD